MWSEVITLPLSPMAWQGPRVGEERHCRGSQGRFEVWSHRTLNPGLTVDSARQGDVKDASLVAQELSLGITSLQADASHPTDRPLLLVSTFMSVQYLSSREQPA